MTDLPKPVVCHAWAHSGDQAITCDIPLRTTTAYGKTIILAHPGEHRAAEWTWRQRAYPIPRAGAGVGAGVRLRELSDLTAILVPVPRLVDLSHSAINLRQLVAASTSETVNARGGDRKTRASGQVAVKREPGTARAGQTGSASPRGEAA